MVECYAVSTLIGEVITVILCLDMNGNIDIRANSPASYKGVIESGST